jgi:TonB family protein
MPLIAPYPAKRDLHSYQTAFESPPREREVEEDGRDRKKAKITFALDEVRIISGSLSKEEVTATVLRHLSDIEVCCRKAELHGTLVISVEIGADGRLRTVQVRSPVLEDKNLEKCLAEAAKRWRFATPSDGKNTLATVTFSGH